MRLFLNEVSTRHPDEHIVMILDGAGWHRAHALQAPQNIHPLKPPPYAPELNPVEHLWDEVREKFFHNRIFSSPRALEEPLMRALQSLERHPGTVASIVSWPWIIGALLVALLN